MAVTLSARQVIAFSDAELNQYLERNRHSDGAIYVAVQDPENLTAEFIERLRERSNNPVKSRPADLDEVAARLCNLPAETEAVSRLPSRAPTESTISEPSVTEEEQHNEDVEFATKAYYSLIQDGGRPLFPLGLLEDAHEHVEKYRETFPLTAWRSGYPGRPQEDWMVFSRQLNRWNDFRRLQRYAREHKAASLKQFFFAAVSPTTPWDVLVAEGERKGEKPATWKDYNEAYLKPGKEGFREYRKMVRKRLARHGFTRTYKLHKDPARQDKLTTWIEYLNYEYWWLDRAVDFVEYHRPSVNRYCERLLDSGTLQQSELENITSGNTSKKMEDTLRHVRERVEAERAVASAKLAMERLQTSPDEQDTRDGRLAEAQSTLDAAVAKHEAIVKRNNDVSSFIQRTNEYRIASRDAERHTILVEWVLQQVLLVELEVGPSEAVRDSPQRDIGTWKRKRDDAEAPVTPPTSEQDHGVEQHDTSKDERRPPKRTRFDSKSAMPTPGTSVHTSPSIGHPEHSKNTAAPAERNEEKRKRSSEDDFQDSSHLKLRRSARIAELAKRRAVTAPSWGIAKTVTKLRRTNHRKSIRRGLSLV